MRKCSKCGYEGESKFCPECGAEMQEIIETPKDNNVITIDNEVKSAAKEIKPKEKKPINKKVVAIFAGIIVVIAIIVYLCIPMGRATFSSEAEMQKYCCGVFESVEDGKLICRLVIDEKSFDEYFVALGSNHTIEDMRIKKWNYKRGYIDTIVGKIITNKDGSIKFDDRIYQYAGDSFDDTTNIDSDESKTEEKEEKEDATTGEKNALKSAESYLSGSSGFSESKLRDQLEFEGFTDSEIDYAIDNCSADWEAQCKKCAESYLSGSSSFSKQGLIEQLEFEGFDHDMVVDVVEEVY